MINCNPETVSTDYDTSSRLYFEPLTTEDVLAVIEKERPLGVIVQLGGQTPLNLAPRLEKAGVRVLGTSTDAIDVAEDRERFSALCAELGILQPAHGVARTVQEAGDVADRVGYPILVRPSYVLGGRAMRVIYEPSELDDYLRHLTRIGAGVDLASAPLLIDRFLENATEVDVDAVFDGEELLVGGMLEHAEEAGVHSGDSTCVIPPQTIAAAAQQQIIEYTRLIAQGLGVRGLLNLQLAVRGDEVLLLEANPRASRTVPFVSKATGVPLAKIATRVMMGETIEELRKAGLIHGSNGTHSSVKKAILPWNRFPTEDVILGPEMRATGEVMGIASDYPVAMAKAEIASGHRLPEGGTLFLSLADRDKAHAVELAKRALNLGLRMLVTAGTAAELSEHYIPITVVDKVGDGPWDPVQLIDAGMIDLVINTPRGRRARSDGRLIRQAAHRANIPCITTPGGAYAFLDGLGAQRSGVTLVAPLQDYIP
jgi:carbamoyl-phosphate synthase large subunit